MSDVNVPVPAVPAVPTVPAPILTLDTIRAHRPCARDFALVAAEFPDGIPLVAASIPRILALDVDLVWASCLVPSSRRATYAAAFAEARAAYHAVLAPARASHDAAVAPANAVLRAAVDEARAAYYAAVAPARAAYHAALAGARAAYRAALAGVLLEALAT